MTGLPLLLIGSGLTLFTTLLVQFISYRRESRGREEEMNRQNLTRFHETKVQIYARFLRAARLASQSPNRADPATVDDLQNCLAEVSLVTDTLVERAAIDLAAAATAPAPSPTASQSIATREAQFLELARAELRGPKVWPTRNA